MAITIKLTLVRDKDFKSGYNVEIKESFTKKFFYTPKEQAWRNLKKRLTL